MIFITVGTHEQGMDRLLKQIDDLIDKGYIKDEVFAQIGYTEYIPKNFQYQKMIGYDEMDEWVRKSDIIVTHGGPGSIFHSLQYGKIPVVVPRNPDFNEHVDDHQILFAKRLEKEGKIIGIYEIKDLEVAIFDYNRLIKTCVHSNSNALDFIHKFDKLVKNKLNLI